MILRLGSAASVASFPFQCAIENEPFPRDLHLCLSKVEECSRHLISGYELH
jgi:hypothetical protein